ncbi:avidin/streptavidin family protein [Kitasatospora terrestris]|uniref:Avidin family protein n=1 Tax=Kitasatospora terrestris TaxID=258051 RepID=A0ABP9DE69_9ACTN
MGIAGDWYSEQGSHMHLETDPSGGVTGTYTSALGRAAGTYPLVGRFDPLREAGRGTAIGWTVAWRNEDADAGSVTSWSGEYRAGDQERITAGWLLTRSADAPDSWESTMVGQDTFTRR